MTTETNEADQRDLETARFLFGNVTIAGKCHACGAEIFSEDADEVEAIAGTVGEITEQVTQRLWPDQIAEKRPPFVNENLAEWVRHILRAISWHTVRCEANKKRGNDERHTVT